MANGLSVKQAIENELDGKEKYSIDDTVKCIKHIAAGIDNLPVTQCQKRLDVLESDSRWYKRIYVFIAGIIGGSLAIVGEWFLHRKGGG